MGCIGMDNGVNSNKRKVIIVTENIMNDLSGTMEISEYKFYSTIKKFLGNLLTDPVNASAPFLLRCHDLDKARLIKLLLSKGIIEKEERIEDKYGDSGTKTVTMIIKYKVPKKDFDRKLKKLYIELFEENLPILEDGATGCDSSGQYSAPLFGVYKRTFSDIKEATATSGVGAYQYDAPAFGDKESLSRRDRRNGSVSVNNV